MSYSGVVMKYGGSSVADTKEINKVADRIIQRRKNNSNIIVVVSAMGKTTNNLIGMTQYFTKNPNKREMDSLLSTGEQISISLLSIALNAKGCKAISLTGWQAGVKTFGYHMKSKIEDINSEIIKKYIDDNYVVIVAGFQGINENNDITTLGRGGSDTSAVAIAAKMGYCCEIYTDVEGIYTIDPRIFNPAKKLNYLSYEETLEMASLGAKVIEPRSVELAWKYKVPLYIAMNTNDVKGTTISDKEVDMEKNSITNISVLSNILLVNIELNPKNTDSFNEVFACLGKENVNIDIISQNKFSKTTYLASFTTTDDNRAIVEEILNSMDIRFNFVENVSKVSIIGNAMRTQAGVASEVFDILLKNNIEFHQVSTSEISISYVIDNFNVNIIVGILAKEFNL